MILDRSIRKPSRLRYNLHLAELFQTIAPIIQITQSDTLHPYYTTAIPYLSRKNPHSWMIQFTVSTRFRAS